MTVNTTIFNVILAAITWSYTFSLQRPPPRYSQQYMPRTSFTCHNKIVGSYYADPETECQLFHVCVSVAGNIQDYRFLCPNDTAFDQESQTCADWYDVDCEAATLYYASDNFDLYRIGSGLESLHYDNLRSEFEPQDHLQRSESNDPIRSSLSSYSSNNFKNVDSIKKNTNFRMNDNNNQYNAKKQKTVNTNIEKEKNFEFEKKFNLRKMNRNPLNDVSTNPPTSLLENNHQKDIVYSKTNLRLSSLPDTPKFIQVSSTPRSTTWFTSTIAMMVNTNSKDASHTNYPTTTIKSNHHNNLTNLDRFKTTTKSIKIMNPYHLELQNQKTYNNYNGSYKNDYSNHNFDKNNKSMNNHNNNNHNVYYDNNSNNYNNNIQKNNISLYSSTITALNDGSNHNSHNYDFNYESSKKGPQYSQKTYTINTFAPTTYSPVVKKFNNNKVHYDKLTIITTKATQGSETDEIKAIKKITHPNGYYNNLETNTRSYDFSRPTVGLGFSPSSVNYLAENIKATTPTSRRGAVPTTHNLNNFNVNTNQSPGQLFQQKSTHYQNQSAIPFVQSTTTKHLQETTMNSKISKKNDYDYAYYDNGPLEYDNIELEHVISNKESIKIA